VGADRFPGAATSLGVAGLLFTAALIAVNERGRGGRVSRLNATLYSPLCLALGAAAAAARSAAAG